MSSGIRILLFSNPPIHPHNHPKLQVSKEYLLDLIQPNRKTSLLEYLFPPLPPIALISPPPTCLTCLLLLLPLCGDLFMFSKETIERRPQLLDLVDELEFRLDLVRDGSEDWVRWRVLEKGKEKRV